MKVADAVQTELVGQAVHDPEDKKCVVKQVKATVELVQVAAPVPHAEHDPDDKKNPD